MSTAPSIASAVRYSSNESINMGYLTLPKDPVLQLR